LHDIKHDKLDFQNAYYTVAVLAQAQDLPNLQLFLRRYEGLLPRMPMEFCEDSIRTLMDPHPPDDWPMSYQMWNLVQRGNPDDLVAELQKPGMDAISEEYCYVMLLQFAARVPLEEWRKVQVFVAARGVRVDDVEYYNGRIAFGAAKHVQEVLRDMDVQGVKYGIGTYDALIYTTGVRDNLQECQKLLGEISEKQLIPTSRTFCAILDFWRSRGKLENTMRFWDEMCRLQITPSPIAHEKVKEVIYQYATKIDKEELQILYKHVNTNDIPTHLVGFHAIAAPDESLYESKRRLASEFEFSSRFKVPKTPKRSPPSTLANSTSHSFTEFTYRNGANLAELSNYMAASLPSIPSKTESPNMVFIPLEITSSEVDQYDEMRNSLRESNKNTTVFLNKALQVFRDYTKRWFNQILLDLAEDNVELTSEGYSALVHRAWKSGDREECNRLLAKMSLNSIAETEEVTKVRQELFNTQPQQTDNNDLLRVLLRYSPESPNPPPPPKKKKI
jgi:hypothetical protein